MEEDSKASQTLSTRSGGLAYRGALGDGKRRHSQTTPMLATNTLSSSEICSEYAALDSSALRSLYKLAAGRGLFVEHA